MSPAEDSWAEQHFLKVIVLVIAGHKKKEALPALGLLEMASESTYKREEKAEGQLEGEFSLAVRTGGV